MMDYWDERNDVDDDDDDVQSITSSIEFDDSSRLLDDLANLFEETHLCDVHIICGNTNEHTNNSYLNHKHDDNFNVTQSNLLPSSPTTIHAHSTILKARSHYFNKLLNKTWRQDNPLHKPNISTETLHPIIKYLHTGQILFPTNPTTLFDLLIAVDELDITTLTPALIQTLQNHLTNNPSIFYKLLNHAQQSHTTLPPITHNLLLTTLTENPQILHNLPPNPSPLTLTNLTLLTYQSNAPHLSQTLLSQLHPHITPLPTPNLPPIPKFIHQLKTFTSTFTSTTTINTTPSSLWAFLINLQINTLQTLHYNPYTTPTTNTPYFLGTLTTPQKQLYSMTILLGDMDEANLYNMNIGIDNLQVAFIEDESGENSIVGWRAVVVLQQVVLPQGVEGVVVSFEKGVRVRYGDEGGGKWDGGGDVLFMSEWFGGEVLGALSEFRGRGRKSLVIRQREFFVRYCVEGSDVLHKHDNGSCRDRGQASLDP